MGGTKERKKEKKVPSKHREVASNSSKLLSRKTSLRLNEILSEITTSITSLKTRQRPKRALAAIFIEKPCSQTYPDYYVIIQHPIAINDILGKCIECEYEYVQDFIQDWELLFSNARRYNEEGSWVVEDACKMEMELYRL